MTRNGMCAVITICSFFCSSLQEPPDMKFKKIAGVIVVEAPVNDDLMHALLYSRT